ncbi:hypothetical protein BU15DRAFT_91070 [Melanogaster broomeanus]|nr:hypothetical protein BU15DRAFT_91070 [Melanogaster broomeanus]
MSDPQNISSVLDEMTASMAATRELIQSLREKQSSTDQMDTSDGISLLSLKHHLMLFYLQSLVLLSSRRAAGDSLQNRAPASLPFSAVDRSARGAGLGDRVDSMIEGRVVLEKVKVLESRMRYQIEKLVRIADDASKNVADDPLAFRPNPQSLSRQRPRIRCRIRQGPKRDEENRDGIYGPRSWLPMPYTETAGDKRSKHRAREVQRMTEFEEDNFTRLVMKKKDMRRRKQDEEDLALGGTASSRSGRRARGLEDEFQDVMGAIGDGYEELRQKGKKSDALSRARTRRLDNVDGGDEDIPQAKRGRFEKERRSLGKRMAKSERK